MKYLFALLIVLFGDLFCRFFPIDFICWFSDKFYDIHDYKKHLGGTGTPDHFYEYTCWNCNKKFNI